MHCDQITADRPLPSLRADQRHYPQVRAGVIVTMPGPDHSPLVFPTLCGGAYARRLRDGETVDLALCSSCAELRADQHIPAA